MTQTMWIIRADGAPEEVEVEDCAAGWVYLPQHRCSHLRCNLFETEAAALKQAIADARAAVSDKLNLVRRLSARYFDLTDNSIPNSNIIEVD